MLGGGPSRSVPEEGQTGGQEGRRCGREQQREPVYGVVEDQAADGWRDDLSERQHHGQAREGVGDLRGADHGREDRREQPGDSTHDGAEQEPRQHHEHLVAGVDGHDGGRGTGGELVDPQKETVPPAISHRAQDAAGDGADAHGGPGEG